MELLTKKYRTCYQIKGPLIFVKKVKGMVFGATCNIELSGVEKRYLRGQVIDASEEVGVIQVFEETIGLEAQSLTVSFAEEGINLGVSLALLGRIFTGLGKPRDGLPEIIPDVYLPVSGSPMNPVARDNPVDFIETGLSAIDGLNTLVRGQKLPIFSLAGLPANEIACQIVDYAEIKGEESFAVIFGGMGITSREADYFISHFQQSGALSHTIAFLNLADEPVVERLLTPRFALTCAEYLAFEKDFNVLVILTDMTNYCEALRQVSSAREEVPGRRGYPGYMYTDLATIYERAGRLNNKKGSITLIPILTMPGDDITHPIVDLTGYITEGQIVLSRGLYRKGVFPPIDILPCLSRLMNAGIGEGKTRAEHRELANQLYASYAHGCDLRKLRDIVGEDALTDLDKTYLKFSDAIEELFIGQKERRTIDDTLNLGWSLLSLLPKTELKRISRRFIDRYLEELKDWAKWER